MGATPRVDAGLLPVPQEARLARPERQNLHRHVKPFIDENPISRALHFSMCEVQSRMQLRDPHALALEYTRTMMGFLLFNPQPRNIVMIGLGGGSLAKFCYRHLPQSHIQVVEINPHVIALRDEFHVPPDDERFTVLCGDGAQFVRDGSNRCDVLLVDGFDSDGLPARLCSRRFYDDCRKALQPDGIMVVNLYVGHPRYDLHVERIRRSFDDALLVVDDGEQRNRIAFACNGNALDRRLPGVVRRPKNLDRRAADQLLAALARVASAHEQMWLCHFAHSPRGAEPAPSERLRAHERLAKAIGLASPMADAVCRRPGGALNDQRR